jgi:hypothetical protein
MSCNYLSKFPPASLAAKDNNCNRMSEKYPDVNFYGLDVTEVKVAKQELQIKGLPMILFFKNGDKVDEIIGMSNPKAIDALLQTCLLSKDAKGSVEAVDLLGGVADLDIEDEDLEPGTCTTCRFQLLTKPFSSDERESLSTRDWRVRLDRLDGNAKSCEYCLFLLRTCERDPVRINGLKANGGKVWIQTLPDSQGFLRLELSGPSGKTYAVTQGPFKPMVKTKRFNSRILRMTSQQGDSAHFSGRFVKELIDFERCRDWLKRCKDHHSKTCLEETMDPKVFGMRLIDVKTRSIVPAQKGAQYVALSYVWGHREVAKPLMLSKNTRDRLTGPGGLSDSHFYIPKVVHDAMVITSELGFDFLWIDALCIVQDDDEDIGRQIGKMDQVYSCASLTIVSTEPHANCDIPGVRENTRTPDQTVCKIGHLELINTLPTLSQAFESSEWDTRGWTLQEKALSKRLLIFTKSQVYWLCNSTVYAEDTNLELSADTRSLKEIAKEYEGRGWEAESTERIDKSLFNDNSAFDNYQALLKLYMVRGLTKHSDAINAFTAVLNVVAPKLGRHHWGLPTGRFHWALSWKASRHFPSLRENGFPSWSWAGWRGRRDVKVHDAFNFGTSSKILWWKMSGKEILEPINSQEEDEPDLGYTHGFFGVDSTSPLPRSDEAHSKLTEDEKQWLEKLDKTHILRFWTSVASITIGRTPGEKHGRDCSGFPMYVPGQEASISTIILNNAWRAKQSRDQFDFIFLSRTCEDSKSKYDTRLETLLVEGEKGIVYRVQMPRYHIRLSQWESAKPEFRLITLA